MAKRKHFSKVAIFSLGSLLLSGCTHLIVDRLSDGAGAFPDGSIPYILPRKTFVVSATYVLKDCISPSVKLTGGSLVDLLDLDVEVTPVGFDEPDPDQRYYINYRRQRSHLKDTDFTVESYGNQTLKSFNGTVTDQVGPTAIAALNTAVKIASIAAILNVQESDYAQKSGEYQRRIHATPDACTQKAREMLDVLKKKPAKAASDGDAVAKQRAIEFLTFKETVTWTPSPGDLSVKIGLADEAIHRWVSRFGQTLLSRSKGDVEMRLYVPRWAEPLVRAPDEKDKQGPFPGFVVRNPVPVIRLICRQNCPESFGEAASHAEPTSTANQISSDQLMIPQLARLFVLPVDNGLNQQSKLVLTMEADGVLSKIGMSSTNTNAEALNSLGTATDSAATALSTIEKAKNDARTAAKNASVEANKTLADCLQAQKSIVANGGIPIGACQ